MASWLIILVGTLCSLIVTLLVTLVLFGLIYRACTKYCPKHWRMDGKTVIVTGASSGLGLETALELARRGARVILACRNLTKAQLVADHIISQSGNTDIVARQLELSDFNSVRKFARQIIEEEPSLHVLINNAGITGFEKRKITPDGHELTIATNHYGPFLLTLLLLEKLMSSPASRIVNLSSLAYITGKLDVTDMNFDRRKYNFSGAYSQSKLANILFTKELAERLNGTSYLNVGLKNGKNHRDPIGGASWPLQNADVVTNSVNPGLGNTDLIKHPDYRDIVRRMAAFFARVVCRTPEQSAQTQIYLAVSDEGGAVSGCYYSNCQKDSLYFDANNMQLAKQLWTVSCRAVKLANGETAPSCLAD